MAIETLSFLISALALLISFSLLIFLILRSSSRTQSPQSGERAKCLNQLAELSGAYAEFAESLTVVLAGLNAAKAEARAGKLSKLVERVVVARSQLKSRYGAVLDGRTLSDEALAGIGHQIEALRRQLETERVLAEGIRAGQDELVEMPAGSEESPVGEKVLPNP